MLEIEYSLGHMAGREWEKGLDSAGGAHIKMTIINHNPKTIKYLGVYFNAYNAVDDKVKCTIMEVYDRGVKCTGPFECGKRCNGIVFDEAFYNNSITSVRPFKVAVQYMDGSSELLTGKDLILKDMNK